MVGAWSAGLEFGTQGMARSSHVKEDHGNQEITKGRYQSDLPGEEVASVASRHCILGFCTAI